MSILQRPGNPQGYGFVLTDTIPTNAFCVWDPTATATSNGAAFTGGAMRPLNPAIASSGAFFLGVTQGQYPLSSPIDNGNPLEPLQAIIVQREGIFSFKTTNSETYVHGTKVYAAAAGDNLTVTTVSSANTLVGYVNLPDGSVITGAAGQLVPIELNADTTKGSNAILSA